MSSTCRAVILAAGKGSRLVPLTENKPKCLVRVYGKPILGYQIDAFLDNGIKDIIVVAGYKFDMVKRFVDENYGGNVKVLENRDYDTTNNMYSLYLLKDYINGESFFLCNGDVIFDKTILSSYLQLEDENSTIFYDSECFSDESMKIVIDKEGYVRSISKDIKSHKASGCSIDLYFFKRKESELLFDEMRKIIEVDDNKVQWTEVAILKLVKNPEVFVKPFDIAGKRWVEIDTLEDLLIADIEFSQLKSLLRNKRIFFIDMDGTIYIGNRPVSGAKQLISKLKSSKRQFYLLSNNSSRTKVDYVYKLRNMGIEINDKNIILSTDGVIDYFKREEIKKLFILGTESVVKFFESCGFLIDCDNPEAIVLTYDTDINYEKIKKAALLIQQGKEFIATHCDKVCPTENGPIPDVGSMIKMFEVATGVRPKVFGKPNPEMVGYILKRANISPRDVVIIGDRLYTDLKLAKEIGVDFVCVLSGETTRLDIDELPAGSFPDLVVKDISVLVDLVS